MDGGQKARRTGVEDDLLGRLRMRSLRVGEGDADGPVDPNLRVDRSVNDPRRLAQDVEVDDGGENRRQHRNRDQPGAGAGYQEVPESGHRRRSVSGAQIERPAEPQDRHTGRRGESRLRACE
jgi:hypothetical protein